MLISRILAFIVVIAFASGCSQGPGTILHKIGLDSDGKAGPSYTTGARQRLISSMTTGVASSPGRVHPRQIICVEPSPDVAIAVANSFGVGVSILGQGSGSLSGTQVEGVAQIAERTVAIQALLKQGYQACLDYANGAITGTTYSLRQSRLDDLLVTMLLAENASGAFGRSGAHLGTKASAEAQASLSSAGSASADIEKLQDDLAKVEQEIAAKEAEVETAKTAVATAPADKKQDEETKLKAEEAQLSALQARRRAILSQLKSTTDTLTKAAGEVNKAAGIGGLTARPSAEIASVLSEMQGRFLDKDVDQSVIATCLTELGHRNVATREDDDFRNLMYRRLHDASAIPDDSGKTEHLGELANQMLEDFYLGSQLAGKNRLTIYCERTLEQFVETSIQNRHELKLKKLEVEQSRLALLTKQAASAAERRVLHPSAVMAQLAGELVAFQAKRDELNNLTVPAEKTGFTAAAKTALENAKNNQTTRNDDIIGQVTTATTGTQKADIEGLEARYLTLIADTDKNGSATQRKLWKAKFDTQQAEAEMKIREMQKLSKRLIGALNETVELIRRIKAI